MRQALKTAQRISSNFGELCAFLFFLIYNQSRSKIKKKKKKMVIHSVISTPKYFAYLCTHSARSICLCCFKNTHSKQMQVPGLSGILSITNKTITQLLALKSPRGGRKSCEFTNREII